MRRVIFAEHEAPDFVPMRLAIGLPLRPDDGRDLGRNHVAIRVHRYQKAASFERKADAAPRWSRARSAAQTHGLALEVEQLFGIDLAADALDRHQELPLEGRELFDLTRQALARGEHLPRRLEAERDRRSRRAPEVVAGDGRGDVLRELM